MHVYVYVWIIPAVCFRYSLFKSREKLTQILCMEDVAHNAAEYVTRRRHLVCPIIVIDGRVSSRCSSPFCQVCTSGNEIQVLSVKRNFESAGQEVTTFPDRQGEDPETWCDHTAELSHNFILKGEKKTDWNAGKHYQPSLKTEFNYWELVEIWYKFHLIQLGSQH